MLHKASRQVPHDALRRACLPIEPLEPRTLLAVYPLGPEFRVNSYTNSNQSAPAIASDAQGNFVVAWASFGQDSNRTGIYAQRYSADGLPQSSEFRVNTYTAGDQLSPAIAMDADGDFVIAWQSNNQDGGGYGIYAQRYNAAGEPQGTEFRVNSYTTNNQRNPSVAADADGDFVIAWDSASQDGSGCGIYAQRYNAVGESQGTEFRVNTCTSGMQEQPALAIDRTGSFVVVWQSYGQDGDNWGIYAQRYDTAGVAQGHEFRVNTYTDNYQSDPTIALDGDGDFVIAWESYHDSSLTGIFAQRYNAAGQPQGGEFRVNTYTGWRQSSPAIAMNANGDSVIAWQSDRQDGSSYGIYAQCYNAAGIPHGGEFRVNNYTNFDQRAPALAMDADGDLVVTWQSYLQDASSYGIYAQRYMAVPNPASVGGRVWNDTNGNNVQNSGESGISTVTVKLYSAFGSLLFSTTTNSSGSYRFDVLLPGSYYIEFVRFYKKFFSYQDQGTDETLDSDADSTTGHTAVFSLQAGQNQLSIDAGLIPACSVSGVAYQDLNGNGLRDPDDILLRDVHIFPDFNDNGQQDMEEIGVLTVNGQYSFPELRAGSYRLRVALPDLYRPTSPEKSFLLVELGIGQSLTNLDIAAQKINLPVSQPVGTEFRVNTNTYNSQHWPSVAMDGDGDFVIAWVSVGQAAGRDGIYAQRYNVTGQPQGSEFLVDAYSGYGQYAPALAMDADGDFVIAWINQDGSDWGIFAQRYNAAGQPQGARFRVNTFTSGTQRFPAAAMDADGDFVIAWDGRGQDDIGGVFAQRYNSAGQPQGTEFRVNTAVQDAQVSPAVAMHADGDFVVTWATYGQERGIYAQRYNAAGQPQGSEFRVSTYTDGDQGHPDITMGSAGDFVIAWRSSGQDGSWGGIYAQRYNAAGLPNGSEFQVNTYTPGDQYGAHVAMGASGDFLVVWASSGTGSHEVFAQRYNAAGEPEGSEFRVNTNASNNQNGPTLAMDADGDFVIAWHSQYQDGSQWGVYAQRYEHGTHEMTATTLADTIRLTRSGDRVAISIDGVSPISLYTHPLNSTWPLTLAGLAGDDRLILDFSNGNPIPAAGLTFTGGDGNDTLLFTTSTTYASFTTSLDLADNTLLISNATLPLVESWLRANLLFSSLKTQYTTLAPFSQPDGSILVKRTYFGDVNGDGVINLTDYFTIDSGYLNQRQGFTHGDANLDGQINLDDYFLIDSAYLNQIGPLAATMANSILVSASSDQPTRIPQAKGKTGGRKKVFSTRRVKAGHRGRLQTRQPKLSR